MMEFSTELSAIVTASTVLFLKYVNKYSVDSDKINGKINDKTVVTLYTTSDIHIYTRGSETEETDKDEDRVSTESRRYRPLPLDREMGYMITLR
jgi:hypothetical protein